VRPELQGLEAAYADQRLNFHYVPSTTEWLVSLFVVAFGIALFFIGYWLLPLTRHAGEPTPAAASDAG
jgi:Ni/Fe-hydrogenase subunit HybB-like protein